MDYKNIESLNTALVKCWRYMDNICGITSSSSAIFLWFIISMVIPLINAKQQKDYIVNSSKSDKIPKLEGIYELRNMIAHLDNYIGVIEAIKSVYSTGRDAIVEMFASEQVQYDIGELMDEAVKCL